MGLFNKKLALELVDESFEKAMRKVGLEKYTGTLYQIAKKSIYLDPQRVDEDAIPIGASKIGGHPDLYSGFIWPTHNGVYLSFLAQINLGEVREFHDGMLLPRSGYLYFFYDCVNMPNGTHVDHKEAFRVIYCDVPQDTIKRLPFPEQLTKQKNCVFPSCSVKFYNKWSLPSYEERKFNNDNYLDYVAIEDGKETYLLGYCKNIQDDVRTTCAMVSLNINAGEKVSITGRETKRINKEKQDWILLFQIASVEEYKMMWRDMGILYFMIKEDDLRNHRFDESWLVLQCY